VDFNVGDDFEGFCEQNVSVCMGPMVNGYGCYGCFLILMNTHLSGSVFVMLFRICSVN
jgi:hypothetical protein